MKGDGWYNGAIAGLVVVMVFLVIQVVVGVLTDSSCAEWGWAGSKTTPSYGRYCVSRVGQTDVVAPFAKASQGPLPYAREIGIHP